MNNNEKERLFKEQLIRDENRVKMELLNDEKYYYLKEFYSRHFDEISQILGCLNSRLAIEDIMALESSLFNGSSDEFLFMKQINDAIKDGVISSDDF